MALMSECKLDLHVFLEDRRETNKMLNAINKAEVVQLSGHMKNCCCFGEIGS